MLRGAQLRGDESFYDEAVGPLMKLFGKAQKACSQRFVFKETSRRASGPFTYHAVLFVFRCLQFGLIQACRSSYG
jgi:hypothetical protein